MLMCLVILIGVGLSSDSAYVDKRIFGGSWMLLGLSNNIVFPVVICNKLMLSLCKFEYYLLKLLRVV